MSSHKTLSILITALGGEGGGTLMNWILECARKENFFVQGTSVPGVAQRTGSTSYYIEICDQDFEKGKEPVLSLYPKPARVDVVIASELLEAARVLEKGYVHPDRTLLITSSSRIYTNLEKSHLADGRFDTDRILAACDKMSKNFICLDLNNIALNHSTIVSAPMFGALAGCNIFPWNKKVCENIFQKDDFEFNLKVNRNLGFTQNITVRGSIEDYYGQVIKKYSPWSNYKISTVGTKKYSPNLAEGIYQLKFQIENLSCSDLYQENNIVTKFIAINPEYKVFSNCILRLVYFSTTSSIAQSSSAIFSC